MHCHLVYVQPGRSTAMKGAGPTCEQFLKHQGADFHHPAAGFGNFRHRRDAIDHHGRGWSRKSGLGVFGVFRETSVGAIHAHGRCLPSSRSVGGPLVTEGVEELQNFGLCHTAGSADIHTIPTRNGSLFPQGASREKEGVYS